jgi:hypothetical protein
MVDRVSKSMAKAKGVAEELEEQEDRLRMPVEQLGQVYEATAMLGEGKLNMSMTRHLALTEKIGAATRLFGTSGEAAAFRITRAVMSGGEVMRPYGDKFAIWLKDAIGPVGKKHHLSPDAVMGRIETKMKDLVPAAQAMSAGLNGSMFSIQDFVTHTARDLSSPIFQHVSGMIEDWQKKLDKMRDSSGIKVMQAYGEKLLTVFKDMGTATKFVVDNWKILAAIAVAHKLTGVAGGWAGRLGSGAATGVAASALGGASARAVGSMSVTAGTVNVSQGLAAGIAGTTAKSINESMNVKLKPSLADTATKFASVAGKAMMVTEALGALYMGASSLAAWLDSKHDDELAKGREAATTQTAIYAFGRSVKALQHGGAGAESASKSIATAYEAMGLKVGDKASGEKIADHLKALGPEIGSQMLAHLNLLMPQAVHWNSLSAPGMAKEAGREIADAMNRFTEALMKQRPEFFKAPGEKDALKASGRNNIFTGDIHVTQDFKDQNPERVFVAFNDGLAQQARNLTQSAMAHARGL